MFELKPLILLLITCFLCFMGCGSSGDGTCNVESGSDSDTDTDTDSDTDTDTDADSDTDSDADSDTDTDADTDADSDADTDSDSDSDGYALPPPNECSNQFSVADCIKGDSTSGCGGECANDYGPTSRNACESGKEGVPVQFACARHMLFSPEMEQALVDDGYEGAFHYAIVGHDPDQQNLDAGLPNSCCQCYQLVFEAPTYLTNSTITAPPPLIVQSANTQASGPTGFDVFMGAGGFGVFNACSDTVPQGSMNGEYMYTGYPAVGQAFSGGVKPGPDSLACDENGNLTDALIGADACQQKITDACNEMTADIPFIQETSRNSCIQSNSAEHYYHENWNVLVKRVACPTHLTEVTGCKPGGQDSLPAPAPEIQTAAQAQAAGFSAELNGAHYHTTTMQDCCMPTCAWSNNVTIETLDGYNSFYSCGVDGAPITQ